MSDTALLIIDMQNDFLSPQNGIYLDGAKDVVPAIKKLRETGRKQGWAIVHIIREHDPSGADIEKFRRDIFSKTPFCVKGTWGAEEAAEIRPSKDDIVIGKTRFSGFFGTPLDMALRRLGIKKIVLCGAQYPNCIRSTAVDGLALDYDVAICPDATWGSSKEVVEANISDMRRMGVEFKTLAEFEAEE